MIYKVIWYMDIPGLDGERELEIDAVNEDEAWEKATNLLFSRLTIEDIKEL